jgi:hypothetical protein
VLETVDIAETRGTEFRLHTPKEHVRRPALIAQLSHGTELVLIYTRARAYIIGIYAYIYYTNYECQVRNFRYVCVDDVSEHDARQHESEHQLKSDVQKLVNVHRETEERHAAEKELQCDTRDNKNKPN